MNQTAPAPTQVAPRFPRPRTLVFGIGAQKSGKTWLSAYLRDHPDVHLPPRKELHFWNGVRPPHDPFPMKRRESDLALLERHSTGEPPLVERLTGRKRVPPPDQLLAEIRAALAPVYRFVKDRFGAVPESWQTRIGEGVR